MKIPEVRNELLSVANRLELVHDLGSLALEVRTLVKEMHRRPYKRGRRSAPSTASVRARLIALKENTDLSGQEIAHVLKISSGRITDVMRGERP